MFLLPPAVSLVMFLVLWSAGLLSRPGRHGVLCAVGLVLQFGSPGMSPAWAAGLAMNGALAVYFLILAKLRW